MHVVVAAINDRQGRILLTQRPDHVHQGGLWEFPGGKIEAGENVYAALKRELNEELDIITQQAHPLIRIHHDYPDQSVLLDVWRVTGFTGKAYGREGQPLEWVSIDQLSTFNFPDANQSIIKALQLPSVYLITKSQITDTSQFFAKLEMLLQAGIKLVQFRLKNSEISEFRQLAIETLRFCRLYGAKLLINADPGLVEELGVDGVHLSSDRLMALHSRPVSMDKWVAVSCHNAEELKHAIKIGADFAVLSPVLETKSHPDADTLGWTTFFELVDETTMPVFALGGMNPQQMSKAFQHGAQGIAVLSALWDTEGEAQDIGRAVKEYLI
ncbi:MAG: Nudix family hydrolase [Gammaproteobacteria bacterium]|nr:Nudix family hydrolase [Gammaproteobacteria bacterium]